MIFSLSISCTIAAPCFSNAPGLQQYAFQQESRALGGLGMHRLMLAAPSNGSNHCLNHHSDHSAVKLDRQDLDGGSADGGTGLVPQGAAVKRRAGRCGRPGMGRSAPAARGRACCCEAPADAAEQSHRRSLCRCGRPTPTLLASCQALWHCTPVHARRSDFKTTITRQKKGVLLAKPDVLRVCKVDSVNEHRAVSWLKERQRAS